MDSFLNLPAWLQLTFPYLVLDFLLSVEDLEITLATPSSPFIETGYIKSFTTQIKVP
jgi:hypothetical protein